jgi:GT2 family glycosyltransferase
MTNRLISKPVSYPKVYIVILNWNSWQHTIECLESLTKIDYPNYQIVVCDNASSNGSIEHIIEWASGVPIKYSNTNQKLRQLIDPPTLKPISYFELSKFQAENDINTKNENSDLILIQTGKNLGFAGGVNTGIRYSQSCGDMDYVWILNNDTVVDKKALTELVEVISNNPLVGICGSTLLYYDKPEFIQTLGGGRYNPWIGFAKNIMENESYFNVKKIINPDLDYIHGASMIVSKSFLQKIGLMSEDYFLYFEELDWALRSHSQFSIAWAPNSIVFHKEGATIGTSGKASSRSDISDYYLLRNRFLITRKYFKSALVTMYLWIPIIILNRLVNKQWKRVWISMRIPFCRNFKSLDKYFGR